MSEKSAFAGVWCPSVTPFNAQGELDIDALGRHFARLNDSGLDTLLVMGSIGEFASLIQQERLQLIGKPGRCHP